METHSYSKQVYHYKYVKLNHNLEACTADKTNFEKKLLAQKF